MHEHVPKACTPPNNDFLSLLLFGVQMRLVCGSSEQMAQLISAGTLRQDSHIDRCFTPGMHPLLACTCANKNQLFVLRNMLQYMFRALSPAARLLPCLPMLHLQHGVTDASR